MTASRGAGTGHHGAMGQTIERNEKSDASFSRLLGYLRPHRPRLITSGVLVFAASLFQLAGPWLQGVAIDEFISNGDRDGLRRIVGLLVLVYLGAWLSNVIAASTPSPRNG